MGLPFAVNAALFTLDPSGNRRAQIQQDISRVPTFARRLTNAMRIANRYEGQANASARDSRRFIAYDDLRTKIQEAGEALGNLYNDIAAIVPQLRALGWITAEEAGQLSFGQSQPIGIAGYTVTVPEILIGAAIVLAIAALALFVGSGVLALALGVTAATLTSAASIIGNIAAIVGIFAGIDMILQGLATLFSPITDSSGRVIAPSPAQQATAAAGTLLKSPVVALAVAAGAFFLIFGSRGKRAAA